MELGAYISREEMKKVCGGVLYSQCEDAQENLERDDVFSRLFFCHPLTIQHWFVLSCFKATSMKNFIFVGNVF